MQLCGSHQKQGESEKKTVTSQEEPKETWQLNIMWGPDWGPGTEEGQRKTKEVWIK